MKKTRFDIQSITESCFSAHNFFIKIEDFDAEAKYMAISVNYRRCQGQTGERGCAKTEDQQNSDF